MFLKVLEESLCKFLQSKIKFLYSNSFPPRTVSTRNRSRQTQRGEQQWKLGLVIIELMIIKHLLQ